MLNKEHADAECWMLNRCVLTIFLFPWLNTSPGRTQSGWREFRREISVGETESKKKASFMMIFRDELLAQSTKGRKLNIVPKEVQQALGRKSK
jgi:hypothetical protein